MSTKIERVRPITSTERERAANEAHPDTGAELHAQEIHSTSDQIRLFRNHIYVGGTVDHGTVASASEMAALGGSIGAGGSVVAGTAPRGVWVGDSCWRSDDGLEYRCISGHNSTAVWRAVLDLSGVAPAEHTHTAADLPATMPPSAHTHEMQDVSGLGVALAGIGTAIGEKEDALGAPNVDGKILSSTAAGVRTWITPPSGGAGWTAIAGEPAVVDMTTTWSYDGDINGVIYLVGTQKGKALFENPSQSGVVMRAIRSSDGALTVQNITGRVPTDTYTQNTANSWFVIDLMDYALVPTTYSMRHLPSAASPDYIRNWKLQGCNSLTWSVAGVNAATWVDLDTRTNDTTLASAAAWGHWTVSGAAGYRYFRILQTGMNAASRYYLAVSQIELYGVFVNPISVPLPLMARGWMTDSYGAYIPYW